MRRFILLPVAWAGCLLAQCPEGSAPRNTTAGWYGWGNGSSNARFQPADQAGISAAQVPNLKLKWAFGFPGVRSLIGAPSVVGGRVYIGTDNGTVYSLDAETGCQYWSFKADAGVRNVIVQPIILPGTDAPTSVAFFGDQKANVYAVDTAMGGLIWKVKIDDHPRALITGAPVFGSNYLYVPVASGEEGAGGNASYACCTFRGSVVALDYRTGKQIWKTYTIAEAPKQSGKNSNGTQRWAPAGGGVWNSPTVDAKRHALYIGTGDAYTSPAPDTTDSIMAMDLDTGKILWSVQDTQDDTWLAGCTGAKLPENCPAKVGPDHDFGAPPILTTLPDGRTLLIAGQKSGNVWAHDPDKQGAVVWKTPLVSNTTEFGGKIIWGGAADGQNAYFGLGTGGVAAVQLRDGEKQWFMALPPAAAMAAHTGQDGPLTAIPGVVFSGGWDGVLRALSSVNGRVLWEYNTVHDYQTVNGVAGKGGSMGAPGPVVAGGMIFVPSGYVGVKNGMPGNVLLVFEPAK